MPRVTRLCWTVATGLGGSVIDENGIPLLRPEMEIEAEGGDLATVLNDKRLRKFSRFMGHGRIVVRCSGIWTLGQTFDGEGADFRRGLEIIGADIAVDVGEKTLTPAVLVFFARLHGVIWTRCRFRLVRHVKSSGNADELDEINEATARSAFFYCCDGIVLKDCAMQMECRYDKVVLGDDEEDEEDDTLRPGGGNGPWWDDLPWGRDHLEPGGSGGGGNGDGGGSGGGNEPPAGHGGLKPQPKEDDEEPFEIGELPWNGIVALGLWCCENATVLGGSCRFEAECRSRKAEACAVCIGMYACHSAERKSLDMETGGTPLKYGLLSGRVGWCTKSGEQKRGGMVFDLKAKAVATEGKRRQNAQAVCAGMRECRYVTPVDSTANCEAEARVEGGEEPLDGQAYAEAAGFRNVFADRHPAALKGNCRASAMHPARWRAVASPALECSQNVHDAASGTEAYDNHGGY